MEARSANCLSPGAGKWERAGVNLDLAKFSISTLGGRVTSCGWGGGTGKSEMAQFINRDLETKSLLHHPNVTPATFCSTMLWDEVAGLYIPCEVEDRGFREFHNLIPPWLDGWGGWVWCENMGLIDRDLLRKGGGGVSPASLPPSRWHQMMRIKGKERKTSVPKQLLSMHPQMQTVWANS